MHNFLRLIACEMACSPVQSNFLVALAKDINQTTKAIQAVYYAVSETYAKDVYASCRDVQSPSTGGSAMAMLCNVALDQCNASIWLNFMGLSQYAPFKIYYTLSDAASVVVDNVTLYPIQGQAVPCNMSCSCTDCAAACKSLSNDTDTEVEWKIAGMDAMYVIMGCVFVCFIVLFGATTIWSWVADCKSDQKSNSVANSSNNQGSAEVRLIFRSMFCVNSFKDELFFVGTEV